MKKIYTLASSMILLASSLGLATTVSAKTHYSPFIGKVNYTCQQGKRVSVRYHFNNYGLPSAASAYINGRNIIMPRNMDSSDNTETYFGKEGNYNMMTNYMDNKNYRHLDGINILSPSSEILYKSCDPR